MGAVISEIRRIQPNRHLTLLLNFPLVPVMLGLQKVSAKGFLCRSSLFSLHDSGLPTKLLTISSLSLYSLAIKRKKTKKTSISYLNYDRKKLSSTVEKSENLKKPSSVDRILNSSSRSLIGDIDTSSKPTGIENETETFVRQTRQTFGDSLPKNYLSKEEYIVYKRLYGPPIRETTAEDLELLPDHQDLSVPNVQSVLFKQNLDGSLEKVDYDPLSVTSNDQCTENTAVTAIEGTGTHQAIEDDENIHYIARNQREINVIKHLKNEMRASIKQPLTNAEAFQTDFGVEEEQQDDTEQEVMETENNNIEDLYISSDASRTHPHTIAGRSGLSPSTLFLPQKIFIAPITELLSRTKSKHLQLAAEKSLGGKGLPFSVSVPASMKHLPQKEIGLDALQHRMSEIEADVFMSTIMPGAYASIISTIVEVRKRLGQSWLRELMFKDGEGPRILDAGAGGAGIIAWKKIMDAELDMMKDEGILKNEYATIGKSSTVIGSDTLRHRISKILENTSFLPRLPDYVHASQEEQNVGGESNQGRKIYDIVIAPYTLLSQREHYKRKIMVKNLWTLTNPKGGILIIIEKGLPRGFEAVADARSLILDSFIASPGSRFVENDLDSPESHGAMSSEKEEGMIIAPCTNHLKCPLYLNSGLSSGRKDFCHFPQRFIRPPFLQKILGAKSRNHEDIKFSYVAFRRGVDSRKASDKLLMGDEATIQSFEGYEDHDLPETHQDEDYIKSDVTFSTLSLPRVILSPLKRHGHVVLDVCTPSGQLERWTIPKSFSKVAYRDARKSRWGDLWALGAKTRVDKNVRPGRPTQEKTENLKIETNKKKIKKYNIVIGKDGFERFERAGKKIVGRDEKRTKGGRLSKLPGPVGLDDL